MLFAAEGSLMCSNAGECSRYTLHYQSTYREIRNLLRTVGRYLAYTCTDMMMV